MCVPQSHILSSGALVPTCSLVFTQRLSGLPAASRTVSPGHFTDLEVQGHSSNPSILSTNIYLLMNKPNKLANVPLLSY